MPDDADRSNPRDLFSGGTNAATMAPPQRSQQKKEDRSGAAGHY